MVYFRFDIVHIGAGILPAGPDELQACPANGTASTYFSAGRVTSTTCPTCHSWL
ncbi:MAG: hypothetical protein WAZ20_05295 [Methanothrix sp.]|uniref:hypothetical protein n=1 Tax=Methanothrix sp. TaxID=90426 RepID=UPI003BB5CCFB